MNFYNSRIQLDKDVINDVFTHIKENTKMLVFGLGYDSKMWYEGNKNTFFVENKEKYIQMNINNIPANNIIQYDYKTTCSSSITLSDKEIHTFIIPEKLLKEGPFDIIIIDGPEGYSPLTPGRLIPCFWSTLLSKKGTLIYIDDATRQLETFCIEKFFSNYPKKEFTKREKCVKIYM
jgi:hypothetical protein